MSSEDSSFNTYAYLYVNHFNPHNSLEKLIHQNTGGCSGINFKITAELQSNLTYILVVTRDDIFDTGNLLVLVSGPSSVTFNRISRCLIFFYQQFYHYNINHEIHTFFTFIKFSLGLKATYTSELTKETQVYARVCGEGSFYYETIEIKVQHKGNYNFDSNSSILLYGYIYENSFDPSYPNENLLTQSNFTCGQYRFKIITDLQVNIKYILVVTTFSSNVRGLFTLLVTGPQNITLNRIGW